MAKYHVEIHRILRVKVLDVEAASHEAAINAINNDNDLFADINEKTHFFDYANRPGQQRRLVETTITDDYQSQQHLVEVAGDEAGEETLAFKHNDNGDLLAMDHQPYSFMPL